MNEKITNEELLIGRTIAAELEAAKSKAEAKVAQFELHLSRLYRKYGLSDGDCMTEDGTIVRETKADISAPALEAVK